MIRQIAPQFFTLDIPGTLAYYGAKLGFKCLGTWQDPPVYAIVARDQQAIHFRCAEPPKANPNKYSDELLDAYVRSEEHTSELQSRGHLVCRLLLEKKKMQPMHLPCCSHLN